jgi:hypothetical protein
VVLMLRGDKERSGPKSMRVNVILFVCKKPSVNLLTGNLLGNFVPRGLIHLLTLHQ